ncbi:sugar transporter ERD6-like 8 isoform X2 [Rhopalosiphum maidis]|uniref:sugar transporter ERD6-like 8 isoform X2 n=1 Tax=Rhopalosiphum maidis TaxID=43146 RepID=UPI000EFE05B8|nr:sugar transporter ERD6-like 8 isoform X2 [Rhopalosiphum maidis]
MALSNRHEKPKIFTLIYNLSGGAINAQFIITVIAALGAIATGTILGWSSSAQTMFESDESLLPFTVTAKDTQTFSSVFGIGAALGALPAGYVSRTFGRPASIMLFEGFLLVGWIMLVLPTYVWVLSSGRMMQGIGAGALCAVIPSYVGEIAEPRMRGRLGTIFQLFIVIGILYSYTSGAFMNYMPFCIACAFWVILHFIGVLYIPESPYHLMNINDPDRAAASLQILRDSSDTTEELASIKTFVEKQQSQSFTVLEVLSDKVNRKALLISIGCMFFQQMSGINVVIFYMTDIFKSTGSNISPNTCTIIVGIVQVKPIGTSLTTCTNWTLVFVVTYVSTELTRWLGQAGCFLTFSAFCLMGAAFAASIVPETKNKTLAEIQLKLVGKSKIIPVAVNVVEVVGDEAPQMTTTFS